MPIIYDKLFTLMDERGIKKIDLRNQFGFNPKTVDSLVKGKGVNTDTIAKLCELLDCQPGDLMEYVKDSQEASE